MKFPDVMQTVAISAGGRVHIASHNSLAVDAFKIILSLLLMTAAAHGHAFLLAFLIRFEFMNIGVTVGASDLIIEMNRGVVAFEFPDMTNTAINFAHGDIAIRVGFQVVNIPVTACAGILAMNGSGKSCFINLVMTFKALVHGITFRAGFFANTFFDFCGYRRGGQQPGKAQEQKKKGYYSP